jgi:hypothetical protein
LPAEVIFDAITMATAGSEQLAGFPANLEARAIGPNVEGGGLNGQSVSTRTLATFGRPAREVNCDCERTSSPTLLQTLYTRNDPEILGRLESSRKDQVAWIAELRREFQTASKDDKQKSAPSDKTVLDSGRLDQLVTEVFLRTVSRRPTEREIAAAREDINAAKDAFIGLRDLLWAMLNTREFIVNH